MSECNCDGLKAEIDALKNDVRVLININNELGKENIRLKTEDKELRKYMARLDFMIMRKACIRYYRFAHKDLYWLEFADGTKSLAADEPIKAIDVAMKINPV